MVAAQSSPDGRAEMETVMRILAATMILAAAPAGPGWATGALAQSVPTEVTRTAGAEITVHLHPFLTDEDRATLQVIAATPAALEALLGESGGHAAIALAPEEGLMRDGVPADSAIAVGQLRDAAAARREALEGCDAVRRSNSACVIVLEVTPQQ